MPAAVETKGSCLCGDVKYRFTAQTSTTVWPYTSSSSSSNLTCQIRCHCRDCQKVSGSTNTTLVPVPRSSLVFDDESALKQSRSWKHCASPNVTLTATFCGSCGSAIFKEASTTPGMAIIFMGTIHDDGQLMAKQPNVEIWTKYRVTWNAELKGAKQCQGWDVPA